MKTLPIILAASILSLTSTLSMRGADSPVAQAVVVLHPTTGQQCHGVVHFTQDGDSVKVVADLEGLAKIGEDLTGFRLVGFDEYRGGGEK